MLVIYKFWSKSVTEHNFSSVLELHLTIYTLLFLMRWLSKHSEKTNCENLSCTRFWSNATLIPIHSMVKKWSDSILSLLILISLTVYEWILFVNLLYCSFFTCYHDIQKKKKEEDEEGGSKSWAINSNVRSWLPEHPR